MHTSTNVQSHRISLRWIENIRTFCFVFWSNIAVSAPAIFDSPFILCWMLSFCTSLFLCVRHLDFGCTYFYVRLNTWTDSMPKTQHDFFGIFLFFALSKRRTECFFVNVIHVFALVFFFFCCSFQPDGTTNPTNKQRKIDFFAF